MKTCVRKSSWSPKKGMVCRDKEMKELDEQIARADADEKKALKK